MTSATSFLRALAYGLVALLSLSCAQMADSGGGDLNSGGGGGGQGEKKVVLRGSSPVTAGRCTVGTVTLQNAQGVAAPVSAAVNVTVSTGASGLELSTQSDCSSAGSQVTVTVPAGRSYTSVYYKGLEASTTNYRINAAANGYRAGTFDVRVTAASGNGPTDIRLAGSMFVAGCAPFTVTLIDDLNVATGFPTAQTLTATTTRGGFKGSSDCSGDDVTAYALPANTATTLVWVRIPTVGTATLTFGIAGISAQFTVDVVAGPADRVTLSGASTIETNQCMPYDAAITDAYGNPVPGVERTLTLAGLPTYSDACSTAASTVTVGANEASKRFWVRPTTNGSATLTATTNGLAPGSLSITVNPAAGNPRVVAEALAATSAQAGNCIPVRLRLEDASGATLNTPANLAVGVATALASGGSSSAVVKTLLPGTYSCGTAISSATVPTGSSYVDVGVTDTVAESIVLSATAPAYLTGSISLSVIAGPTTAIRVAQSGFPIFANTGCGQISLRPVDGFGNPSAFSGTPSLALSAKNGTVSVGSFQASQDCSGAAIESVTAPAASGGVTPPVSVSFKSPVAGSLAFLASTTVSGVALQGSDTLVVNAAPPAQLAFDSPHPSSAEEGECAGPFRVSLKDSGGSGATNPGPSAIPVQLSSAQAGTSSSVEFFAYSTGGVCTSGIASTSIPPDSGSSAQFFVKGTSEELAYLTAAATGLSSATTQIQILAPEPLTLALDGGTDSFAAGVCQTYTIRLKNPSGVAEAPSATQNVTLSFSSGAPANLPPQFFALNGCSTGGSPITAVTLTPSSPSVQVSMKARFAGALIAALTSQGVSSFSRSFTVTAGAPDHLAFTATGVTATQNLCSPSFGVKAYDVFNNVIRPSSNLSIGLSSTDGQGAFYAPGCSGSALSGISILAGNDQASMSYRTPFVGNATLTAQASSFTTATLPIQIVASPELTLAGNTTATSGMCVPWMIAATPASSSPRTVNLSSNSAVAALRSTSACNTALSSVTLPANSTVPVTFYLLVSAQATSSATIMASASGFSNATRTITVSPQATGTLSLNTPTQTVTSGQCALFTVTASQAFASPRTIHLTANTAAAAFSAVAGCASTAGSLSVTLPANAMTQTFYGKFTSVAAATATITASADFMTSGSITMTINPAPSLTLSGAAQAVSGQCLPYTVNANTTSSVVRNVGLSASPAYGSFRSSSTCATSINSVAIPPGLTSATFYVLFTATATVNTQLTASLSGYTSGTRSVSVSPPPTLSFSQANATAYATQCLPYTVSVSSPWTTPQNIQVTTNNVSIGSLNSSSTCADNGSSMTLVLPANTTTTATFYVKFATLTTTQVMLTATASGATAGSKTIPVFPGAIVFSGNSTAISGQCLPYTLTVAPTIPTARPLVLSVNNSAAVALSTSSSCASPSSSLSLSVAANAASVTVYAKFTTTNGVDVTIQAASTGLPGKAQTVMVTPDLVAERFEVYSPLVSAATPSTTACAGYVGIQLAKNNGTDIHDDRQVILSVSNTTTGSTSSALFYAQGNCDPAAGVQPITSITTTLVLGRAAIYVRFLTEGVHHISVRAPADGALPPVPSQEVAVVTVTDPVAANGFTAYHPMTTTSIARNVCLPAGDFFGVQLAKNGSDVHDARPLTLSATLNGVENASAVEFWTGISCTGSIVNNSTVQMTTTQVYGRAALYMKFKVAGTVKLKVTAPAHGVQPAITNALLSGPVNVQ